jgi:hypothetical protein
MEAEADIARRRFSVQLVAERSSERSGYWYERERRDWLLIFAAPALCTGLVPYEHPHTRLAALGAGQTGTRARNDVRPRTP